MKETMYQTLRLLRNLVRELTDEGFEVNRWLKVILAMLIALPLLIATMELCLPNITNRTMVPFVALSVLSMSIWYGVNKLQPVGVILAASGPRFSITKKVGIAGAWRAIIRWVIYIYLFEVLVCAVTYVVCRFFPIEGVHPALIVFFAVSLLWMILVMIDHAPRTLLSVTPMILILAGSLAFATFGDVKSKPAGFKADMAPGAKVIDLIPNKEGDIVVPYDSNGYRRVRMNWPAQVVVTELERSADPNDWVSLACPTEGKPEGPIRLHGQLLQDPDTDRSDVADCPDEFLVQGHHGGSFRVGKPIPFLVLR